jgi:hypothetical protein
MPEFGLARFAWNGGSAPWVVRSAIADGLERAAAWVRKEIRKKINLRYPPASRPGQPPRRRTGNLYRNIDFWLNRKTLEVRIGPTEDAEYGLYLEFGAPRRNLKPRPHLFKTVREQQKRIINTANRAARIAFNQYARQKSKK